MKITILTVGKNKVAYLLDGEAEYLKRLKHYVQIRIESITPEKITRNIQVEQILQKESMKLLSKIPKNGIVIVLDQRGKQLTSEALSEQLQSFQNQSVSELYFVIGGPHGLHESVRTRAAKVLSLSKMTLMHDMVRLILFEQIYRAYTILAGEKYHK